MYSDLTLRLHSNRLRELATEAELFLVVGVVAPVPEAGSDAAVSFMTPYKNNDTSVMVNKSVQNIYCICRGMYS